MQNFSFNKSSIITFKSIIMCLVLLITVFAQLSPAVAAIRPVIIEEDSAAGIDSGAIFYDLDGDAMSVNNSGQTAFTATVQSGSTYYRTLWKEDDGILSLMYSEGDLPPGISGDASFKNFNVPNISDSGIIAFVGDLEGSDVTYPTNDSGLWKGTPGSVSLVARAGSAVPGSSGDTFGRKFSGGPAFNALINDSGQVAFFNDLNGSIGHYSGLFQETASGLSLIVKTGVTPSGFPDTTYTMIQGGGGVISLNNKGDLPFLADIMCNSGTGYCLDWTDENVSGAELLQMAVSGSIITKYRSFSPAPEMSGVEFQNFSAGEMDMNASGQLIFGGVLRDVDIDKCKCLWTEASGTTALAAREGFQAPGTPEGAVFNEFWRPLINDSGQIAFKAYLKRGENGIDYSNDDGLWLGTAGNLKLIARAGDPAPDTPEGVVFDQFSDYSMNNSGQLCFHAILAGTGIDNSNAEGIWLYDPAGGLSLVVREGGEVTLATGETVTINQIVNNINGGAFSGGSDGRARYFNDNGEIAFSADVSPGYRRGFFIANTDGSGASANLTADAGTNQSVAEGNTVTLDGSGSTATASTIATYSWAQTDSSGVTVSLSDNSAINPTFTAPQVDASTTLVFALTVTSNIGATDTDTVSVTISDSDSGGDDDDDDDDDDSGSSGCFILTTQN